MMTRPKSENPVLIAGGGTGGHIYPGLAIGQAIRNLYSKVPVEFVGAKGGLEEKLVPREGFPLHLIAVGKLHSSVGRWTQLKTLLRLPLAFLKSWQLISRLRPQVILGVGGYASGPVLLVASLRGYKTYIWEPNVFPGLTNRLLSRFVGKCIVVFSEAGRYLPEKKVLPMGLPVRPEIEKLAFETKTASVGSQRTRELRVLVFGGSQGARGINQALTSAVASGTDWLEGVQLIHQTGRLDFEDVQRQYVKYNRPNLLAFDFLYDMDQRLRWADLVICRAGASTVAELAAAGKAAILVPFPAASDNHQQKNAEVLHNSQSGKMILQSELSGARVIEEVTYYKEHPDELLLWGRNVRQFHMPLAAERIAKELVESKQ